MQDLIGSNGNLGNVPRISANLRTPQEVAQLIPDGFEDVVKVTIKSKEIRLELINDEYKDNVLIIPDSLYNPEGNFVEYPHFLIERSIFKKVEIDYFAEPFGDRYIFNQNEMLYMVLQHRLTQYMGHHVVYSNLLSKDIQAVKSFVQHVPSVAYNAVQKNKHAYIIMNIYREDNNELKRKTLGDIIRLKDYLPSVEGWKLLRNQFDIQCSSESGASKVGKLILYPFSKGSIYRSVGHKIKFDKALNIPVMTSLFKSAQNITARNKTHVTANAYEIYDHQPLSNFVEDWVYDTEAYPDLKNPVIEGYKPKDACMKRAVVVISPMCKETKRFLFGEVEASEDFFNTFVWEDHSIIGNFDRFAIPTDGTVVYAETGWNHSDDVMEQVEYLKPITVGYTEEGAHDVPIQIKGVKAVKFLKESVCNGPLGKTKVTFRVARRAGNARCDSNTGFKGFTKGKPNLGKITLADGTVLKPDLCFGMNAFKAKHNSIALARAALAVDLKTYKPKHWSGKLNSLDVKEINDASDSLPSYVYTDQFGKEQTVEIGVIYYRYTELGDIFKSYKLQALSHETGRNLYHNANKDLFNFLWDEYVDKDMKEALQEFQKILFSTNVFEGDDQLPCYTPKQIQREKMFDYERDVILGTIVNFRSATKLLDPEFNPKGFFFDFRGTGRGPLIRIPSANTLKMFENELSTGEWRYHAVFTAISKIINAILSNQLYRVVKSPTEQGNRDTLGDRYLRDIKGIIFTTEDAKEMNVTALTRPMVPGIAMKQVCEALLPDDTALIMCDKTYERALQHCYGDDYELHGLQHSLHAFHVRNPS